MTGADGTYDYKAMAAGIVLAGGEGMGNLLPVVEKELLHYRILDAMMREGFFSSLVFQGGTSLRLCHGSPRYSEDLDFAGGTSFDMDTLKGLGSCISDSLSGMGDDVTVRVKEPRPDADGLTRRWRIAIRTAGQRKDLPSQTIKLEVASIPAYEPQHRPALVNYPMFPALSVKRRARNGLISAIKGTPPDSGCQQPFFLLYRESPHPSRQAKPARKPRRAS